MFWLWVCVIINSKLVAMKEKLQVLFRDQIESINLDYEPNNVSLYVVCLLNKNMP